MHISIEAVDGGFIIWEIAPASSPPIKYVRFKYVRSTVEEAIELLRALLVLTPISRSL
jgi:hypothetical protein